MDGSIIKSLGPASLITSTRSTIKPIQAIPFITSGAADHFGVDEKELAVVCASHEGESIHTETVAGMLERGGLNEGSLRCGAHAPYNEEAAKALERSGEPFTQLHNNCSGKHAGMLLTALFRGLDLDSYLSSSHPIQQEIVKVLSHFCSITEDLPSGIGGCSAPTFGVPLSSLAVAFARLTNPVDRQPEVVAAVHRIVQAMINHPEMIGGTKGRFDTELLKAANGKLICKIGAEAVYSIGVIPCEKYPNGLGISVKMEDGSYRGLGPTVVELLAQLEVLNEAETAALSSFHKPILDNRKGREVGEVRAVFTL